jgi:hypothetical protein
MPRDPYIREKFTREHGEARRVAQEYFANIPRTATESWRHLQSRNYEFTMKRLREPIRTPIDGCHSSPRQSPPWIAVQDGRLVELGGKEMTELTAHQQAPAIPAKQKKAPEELAAMILEDLSQIEGCPQRGVKVTVYGFNPWNAMLTYSVEAGPVPNNLACLTCLLSG